MQSVDAADCCGIPWQVERANKLKKIDDVSIVCTGTLRNPKIKPYVFFQVKIGPTIRPTKCLRGIKRLGEVQNPQAANLDARATSSLLHVYFALSVVIWCMSEKVEREMVLMKSV
jgi:hypothetical protein